MNDLAWELNRSHSRRQLALDEVKHDPKRPYSIEKQNNYVAPTMTAQEHFAKRANAFLKQKWLK